MMRRVRFTFPCCPEALERASPATARGLALAERSGNGPSSAAETGSGSGPESGVSARTAVCEKRGLDSSVLQRRGLLQEKVSGTFYPTRFGSCGTLLRPACRLPPAQQHPLRRAPKPLDSASLRIPVGTRDRGTRCAISVARCAIARIEPNSTIACLRHRRLAAEIRIYCRRQGVAIASSGHDEAWSKVDLMDIGINRSGRQ